MVMKTNDSNTPTIWLRTDRSILRTNTAVTANIRRLETALREGVTATRDVKRPEFYEIEIAGDWYYIHMPGGLSGVYVLRVRANPGDRYSETRELATTVSQ